MKTLTFGYENPNDAFRAGWRKLEPKNKIPEVFITKKAKNMNPGSPLFPTIHKLLHINLIISLALASPFCPRTREDCGGRSPQGDSILGSSRGTKGPHHQVQRAVDPSQPQHPAVPHQNGGPGLQPRDTDGPLRCHNRGNVARIRVLFENRPALNFFIIIFIAAYKIYIFFDSVSRILFKFI